MRGNSRPTKEALATSRQSAPALPPGAKPFLGGIEK